MRPAGDAAGAEGGFVKRTGTECWAVLKGSRLVSVHVGRRPEERAVLAWAWAAGSRREYGAGVALPRDWRRAVRCGYRLVPASVSVAAGV